MNAHEWGRRGVIGQGPAIAGIEKLGNPKLVLLEREAKDRGSFSGFVFSDDDGRRATLMKSNMYSAQRLLSGSFSHARIRISRLRQLG